MSDRTEMATTSSSSTAGEGPIENLVPSRTPNRLFGIARVNADEDSLQWWKMLAPHYPALSQLAKKYLCATSSASERLFSTSGNIVTDK